MPILDKLKNLVSGGAAILVEKVGDAIDKNFTSKEEKEKAKLEFTIALQAHEEKMAEAMAKQFEIEMKDMADARDANVKIQESDKASWWAKNTGYFLDVFVGLIWGVITIYLFARALKMVDNEKADLTAVLSLYSTVTAIFMISIQFHRGTSRSSQEKQKELNKMYEKNGG